METKRLVILRLISESNREHTNLRAKVIWYAKETLGMGQTRSQQNTDTLEVGCLFYPQFIGVNHSFVKNRTQSYKRVSEGCMKDNRPARISKAAAGGPRDSRYR